MKRLRLRQFTALIVLAGSLSGSAGCALPYKVAVNDAGSPQYKRVDISYHVPGGHRAQPRRDAGVIGAAGTQEQSEVNRPTALLKIEYPHAGTEPGVVRATLRLSRRAPSSAKTTFARRLQAKVSWLPGMPSASVVSAAVDDEIWILDFPRQQLDLMLIDLAHSGFFDAQQRHEGTARLSVTVDRGRTSKVWSPEPRLDDVVQRVQREGWLTGDERRIAGRK